MVVLDLVVIAAAVVAVAHEVGEDVDGDRKNDGAVFLCRNVVQGLQVSELQKVNARVSWQALHRAPPI